MVLEEITGFLSDWKISMAVVPLFLLAIAPTTEAAYDFSVYRMHQYDVEKNPFGSRSSLVSFEGRTPTAQQVARKNVLIRIEDLTLTMYQNILQKGPGSILILLPEFIRNEDFKNITEDQLQKIYDAERVLLDFPSQTIPIYFTFENDALTKIYSEIENSSEFAGSAAIFNAGSTVLHQFSVTGKQPEPMKTKLNVLESTLDSLRSDSKVILVTSRMDAFASSFALAKGANSAGSGTAVLLEIARMLSIVYDDDSTRPKVTVMFALMPADGFNFLATKDWLENLEKSGEEKHSEILKKVDLAVCLDALAGRTNGKLFVHVSKPPKPETTPRRFLDALKLAGKENGVDVQLVHTKINIADDRRHWQHERFSLKKVPAMTISSFSDSFTASRHSMTDVYGQISEQDFKNAATIIGEAILGTIYQSNAVANGLSLNFDAVKAWTNQLSQNQRSATNTTKRVNTDVVKHLEKFTGSVDKRLVCEELTLYSNDQTKMSQFLVRPALFDLYLAMIIGMYLGAIFLGIEHFSEIVLLVSPMLAKPELIKKQKAL